MYPTAPVAQAVACQLGLLQVLFTLPVDVLRNSFLARLSSEALQFLRLTSKQAAQLVHDNIEYLWVTMPDLAFLPLVSHSIKRFRTLNSFELFFPDSKLEDCFVSELLHGSQPALQGVTRLSWHDQPFNFNSALAISVACPNLSVLKVVDSPLDCRAAVFNPLTSLTKVSLKGHGLHLGNEVHAMCSLFSLPNLQKLSVKNDPIPSGAMASSNSLQKLKAPDTVLEDIDVATLATIPSLEFLHVAFMSLTTQAPTFVNLTQLVIDEEEAFDLVHIAFFLPQPQLQSVRFSANLFIRDFVDFEGFPINMWPLTRLPEAMLMLERVWEPTDTHAFPRLIFRSLSEQAALEVARNLPNLKRFTEVSLQKMPLQEAFMQLVVGKLASIKEVWMLECEGTNLDSILYLFRQLLQLEDLCITSCPVSGAAVTALACSFGTQKVRISAGAGVFKGANLQAVNSLLASSGAASTLVLDKF